jgi:hypothetical protein
VWVRALRRSQAPAEIGRQQRGVEEDDGAGGAHGGAEPKAAVDREIGPASHTCRHELLNGGINGGVFPADPGPGQEAKKRKAPETPGQGGGGRRHEIDGKRNKEELLAPKAVGQPAEEQGAEHRTGKISAACQADLGVAELEHGALLQGPGHRPDQGDLKAIEDPGDA